tara:strand:+ start:66539 stop:67036 length:498 start_codon:yes stop_codon:yes gene_type:complete
MGIVAKTLFKYKVMLKQLILLFILTLPLAANATFKPHSDAVTAKRLLSEHDKFAKQYQTFSPTPQDVVLMQKLAGKELIVLLGSWCHDSAREVPRLIKLLDESKVELSKITFVTVGYDKRDEAGIALAHDLQYTPTFIIKHNGVEVNRVVEKPSGTLAQDLTLGL